MSLITRPDPRAGLPPWSELGFVASPVDRAAHLRAEAERFAREPETRTYLLGGEMVAFKPQGDALDPLFTHGEALAWAAGEPAFLGLQDGAARLATPFDPARQEEMEAAGLKVIGLRPVGMNGLTSPSHLGPLACGKALLTWHRRHGFCANCGTPTIAVEAGWKRECPACGAQHFPRTDPVVIMLTYRGDDCLLGRQPQFAAGMWSCLAGFVEPGETFEEAVRRETLEEAGIMTGKVVYTASQPWPFPMSLMIGCIAEATSQDITIDPNELEAARWFSREETALMLARTHPDGLFVPPPVGIAHHLVRAFVEGAHV